MIRKIINPDGTFGISYDEDLDSWIPEARYISLTPEQAAEIDSEPTRYIFREGVPGLFCGKPCGVIENPDWSKNCFLSAKLEKYNEIESGYSFACSNYLVNIFKGFYANTSWIATWTKVIDFCTAVNQNVLDTPLRVYEKRPGSKKFTQTYLNNVALSDIKRYKRVLEDSQFSILQPKKRAFIEKLNSAKDISSIYAIKVDYGMVLDEKNAFDLAAKVENMF